MVVFAENLQIFSGTRITTDFDRTGAKMTGFFSHKFDPGQEVENSGLGFDISRIGGFLEADLVYLINNQKIGSDKWPSGFTGKLAPFFEDIHHLLKFDGSLNKIEIQFKTAGVDGFNEFIVNGLLTYNGNTLEPPTEPPDVPDPEVEEGTSFEFFGLDLPQTILLTGGLVAVSVGLLAVSNIASRTLSKKK